MISKITPLFSIRQMISIYSDQTMQPPQSLCVVYSSTNISTIFLAIATVRNQVQQYKGRFYRTIEIL
jgi:hypothetical protein